jgi:Phage integrase family
VFTCLNGDPMAPDRLTRIFKKLVGLVGLPPVRLHDLRHGAACLALSAGVELKVIQEMLGHSSIVLTAGTYTSVLPDAAHSAAEKVADLIIKAGCLVPGTRRRRRRQARRKPRAGTRAGRGQHAGKIRATRRGAVPSPDALYRVVPGHPSKHGTNTETVWSRPLWKDHHPQPRNWFTAARARRAETARAVDTVRNSRRVGPTAGRGPH